LLLAASPGVLGKEVEQRVPAAWGVVAKTRWHVGFFGSKSGEFCSWIATEATVHSTNPAEAGGSSGAVCDQWESPGIWKPDQGAVEDGVTVSLFLTTPDVASVWLKVKQRGGGSEVKRFSTRRLGVRQARRAQVRRDFRYVVLAGEGELCVVRVFAYGVKGRFLGHQRSFCEI
jgi:hypothetical protein